MRHKVEHAVRIWAEGIYDANTRNIIAKINPLSNKPLKETAFSSTIWADGAIKYVTKIIEWFKVAQLDLNSGHNSSPNSGN